MREVRGRTSGAFLTPDDDESDHDMATDNTAAGVRTSGEGVGDEGADGGGPADPDESTDVQSDAGGRSPDDSDSDDWGLPSR